ncbi:hypothetical protein GCM10010349_12380 [Streptomyces flavofungini]|nr:hypothetical protein GCM10010349_12380 [Streptomyces flavofungini]
MRTDSGGGALKGTFSGRGPGALPIALRARPQSPDGLKISRREPPAQGWRHVEPSRPRADSRGRGRPLGRTGGIPRPPRRVGAAPGWASPSVDAIRVINSIFPL